ncbi:hypothetical protein [Bartonella sp. HY038]|uniref:hypothetical protein n=1 Tax=Bartonella sp. HY038 TaxID=2759660 RepID=UPI0015FE3D05|nr:hypothetical protein [Bartonella sp. HY038]
MNAPKIYNYHPSSLEYLGTTFADRSPMEEGVWLFPAFSTLQSPPKFKKNQNVVFLPEQDKWQIIADYRGDVWFDSNGTKVEITTLGNPAEIGLLRQPPKIDQQKVGQEKVYPVLTARQIRLLLRKLDKLPLVQGVINTLPSPKKEDAQIEWDYGLSFDHEHFLVQHIVSGLALDWDSFNEAWHEFSNI